MTGTCQDPETSPETEIQSGSEHILLVDDEESIVALEKRILENLEYTVTATNSSREALEIFTARPEDTQAAKLPPATPFNSHIAAAVHSQKSSSPCIHTKKAAAHTVQRP